MKFVPRIHLKGVPVRNRLIVLALTGLLAACGEMPTDPETIGVQAPLSSTTTQEYTSDGSELTWDPIMPETRIANGTWEANVCTGVPTVGLDADWNRTAGQTAYTPGTASFQTKVSWSGTWINAWNSIEAHDNPYDTDDVQQSWSRYQREITGTGQFELNLLADNCSWIFLDGQLVGYQDDANVSDATTSYPLTLDGTHTLDFIIFDGGGQAGGQYRVETSTDETLFNDTDDDGLTDIAETGIYGTDPNDPDTDGDGVSDGDEVAAGTDPLVADVFDSDEDGIDDDDDAFPNSDLSATVAIGGCDSGVANQVLASGASFMDLIGAAAATARNHGQFVNAVTKLADGWKKDGLISGRDKGQITSCAARSK